MATPLEVHTIVSMPYAENTYIVRLPGRRQALVIDPGLEPVPILEYLEAQELEVAAILNTHGHGDHIAGNRDVKHAFPNALLLIGQGDAHMLSDPWANLSAPFGMEVLSPPADRLLHEGDVLDFADIRLEVREIPGHSPGHVVFIHRSQPICVFGGDVLFRGSVGRTDFPNGDGPLLIRGIRSKLLTLPDDSVVYPGHGPVTTTGHEKRTNPFVRVE
jgi:glyoxylase-like metal-dependent hydrolase (beta-lactamase superfamily II)